MKHIFLAITLILWGMPGCSSADDQTASIGGTDETETGTGYIIGPEGGELSGPEGISLVIPADALAEEVEISIKSASLKFPVGIEPSSAMFQFEPAGLTFATPVTVSFPSDDSTVDVFWTDLGKETFHRLPSTWEDGRVSVQAEHFSFTFTGFRRLSGYCEAVLPLNECQVGVNDGQANATCDVIPAEGPVIPGFCFNYHDGLGNVIGSVCKETGCQSSESQAWMCLNLIDDNCNSLVDSSDIQGCTECKANYNCGGGRVCINGFCESCSSRPVDCTSNHGQPDSACEYMVNEAIPTQGLCMHSTDMNGDTCGTSCWHDTACAAEENCGNHMDDDCNGIVDDGCPSLCSSDAGCAVGEICDDGFCKACPGADLPMECSNGSQHGMPDPNCMYQVGETPPVPGAVCLHITDAAGTVCGSKCTQSTTCGTDEICGNHIDDNCDGVVDEDCVSCNTNSDCQAGERCNIF
jgi:hypothetical protein